MTCNARLKRGGYDDRTNGVYRGGTVHRCNLELDHDGDHSDGDIRWHFERYTDRVRVTT